MQNVQIKRRKRATVRTSNTTDKSWCIANNTDTDLLVITTSSADDQYTDQFYEQSLKALKTTDATDVFTKGTSVTVTLQEADNNIIIVRADNLFPVKTIKADGGTQTLTVTNEDAETMKLAAKFQQMLTAFPTSGLAADFAAALADSDITKATAFFKSTDDYKTLTTDTVVAVQTYYAKYPFVWAYYGEEKTYALYSSDGITNKYVGYLTLTNECTSPLNPEKALPGFTIIYTKEDGSSQPLYYSKGQFADDMNSADPGICLQGLFTLKSILTKNDSDSAIIAVLVGVINGESILGYDQEQALLSNNLTDVSSTLDILLHPEDTKGWLELAGAILATVLGFGVLCKAVMAALEWASRANPLTSAEIRDRIRQTTQQNLDRVKNLGIKDSNRLKIPEDVTASLGDVKSQANALLLKENKAKMQDIGTQQSNMVNKLTEYVDNNELQNVFDSVQTIGDKLLETNAVDLGDSMTSLMTDLKNNATAINSLAGKVRSKLGADERRAMDAAKEASDRLTQQVESNEELRSDLAEDKSPEERRLEELFETF